MLGYLHSFDALLWFVIAAVQAGLSLLLLWRHTERRYPAFSVFIHFSAIKTLFLMIIPSSLPWFIFWSYYAISVIACVLMAMAVGELYVKTFARRWARVPAWVPRNVAIWLAAAISSCLVLAVALRPLGANRYLVIMGGIQAALVSAILISLIVLTVYSRHLSISWRPWPWRIAVGFVIFLSVNSMTIYMLGLTSRETAEMVRRIGQMAYLVSLAWWGCTLCGKETVPDETTAEQMEKMLRMNRHTIAGASQLTEI